MFEKVNPKHPDKIADRIAGAIVDLAYDKQEDPKIAVEALIGHGRCEVKIESSVYIEPREVEIIVWRIAGPEIVVSSFCYGQDEHLAENQRGKVRCGDNGVFKGTPTTREQNALCNIARYLYKHYNADGKYIIDEKAGRLIICQSNMESLKEEEKGHILRDLKYSGIKVNDIVVNPIGPWTGGTSVDTGAVNRKLGSDMGDAVTGGGLHGKDLSKADVTLNIYATMKAMRTGETIELSCAIGDEEIDGIPYEELVQNAKDFIDCIGGFEKFAEWGLL